MEVGTHKAGHQSDFTEDEAPQKQEFFEIFLWFNAQISLILIGIYISSKCAYKYCINVLADWLLVDVVQCCDSLKAQTC